MIDQFTEKSDRAPVSRPPSVPVIDVTSETWETESDTLPGEVFTTTRVTSYDAVAPRAVSRFDFAATVGRIDHADWPDGEGRLRLIIQGFDGTRVTACLTGPIGRRGRMIVPGSLWVSIHVPRLDDETLADLCDEATTLVLNDTLDRWEDVNVRRLYNVHTLLSQREVD